MALNMATAAIGFLLAASAVSMVTVGTISLVKTIKAEQEYKEINTKLTAVKDSTGMSSLADKLDKNNEKNKKDQKDQNEKIELINSEAEINEELRKLETQLNDAKVAKANADRDLNDCNDGVHYMEALKDTLRANIAGLTNAAMNLPGNLAAPLLTAANNPRYGAGAWDSDDFFTRCKAAGKLDLAAGAPVATTTGQLFCQILSIVVQNDGNPVPGNQAQAAFEKLNEISARFRKAAKKEVKTQDKLIGDLTKKIDDKKAELAALQKKNK